jgi:hypothetical protein
MVIDYDKLTNEIALGLSESKTEGNTITKNIIKTEIGDNILGRLVLFRPNPKNSVYHYFHHGWMTEGKKYASYLCPSTYDEACPICKKSITYWKSNNSELQEYSKKLRRKENWLVNMYIINDEKHPENNGTIKIFRFGRQIKNIFDEALTGADKDVFGTNIWRLDEKGCNFRIIVKPNSDKKDAWPSYTASKFLPPSDLGLDGNGVKSILDGAFELENLYDKKLTYEELLAELQKNFLDDMNRSESFESPVERNKPVVQTNQNRKVETNEVSSNQQDDSSNDEIDKLLEELG